jgi:hypothetical protein
VEDKEEAIPDRGPWLYYTTHQVACPVGAWIKEPDAICTCGYTQLVDKAIAQGEANRIAALESAWVKPTDYHTNPWDWFEKDE